METIYFGGTLNPREMTSANNLAFPNYALTKRPAQIHFYRGKLPSPCNVSPTNETQQCNIYNQISFAQQYRTSTTNNASHNSTYGTYEDIAPLNKHGDTYRDRDLRSQFFDDPCFLQIGTDTLSATKNNNKPQGSPNKLANRYGYNHVPPTNLYDKYTVSVPCSNVLQGHPYNSCWNTHNHHVSPYNVYANQTNSKNILRNSPYNSHKEQHSLTNVSQASSYNSFSDQQRTQSDAYKSCADQCILNNTIQNNYDVFQENTKRTDPYMYRDQRDINSSTDNNAYIPYKEDIARTDACSNAYIHQCNSADGHSTQTTPYNACVNQTNTNNDSRTNLYGSHYSNGFKCNNGVNPINTDSSNHLYNIYPNSCTTPTNLAPVTTLYDSYSIPFSIALTHTTSQSSPQTRQYRSPTTPLNAARPRNQFPRQKWINRRLHFQGSNFDNQRQQYVVMRHIIPERYHDVKQPVRLRQISQVCRKTANELSRVATTKIKRSSTQQRFDTAHKKSTVCYGQKMEKSFQIFLTGQDVLLSKHAIDDDGLMPELESACLKKKGKPLKRISSRLLKSAPKPFRDAGKSRYKKSLKWDKPPSEVTSKTKTDTSADDMYVWVDDFSLDHANNVACSPSSLFLRAQNSDSEIIKEADLEESEWLWSECHGEINDMKPTWKILMLEPIFPKLIF